MNEEELMALLMALKPIIKQKLSGDWMAYQLTFMAKVHPDGETIDFVDLQMYSTKPQPTTKH